MPSQVELNAGKVVECVSCEQWFEIRIHKKVHVSLPPSEGEEKAS